MTHVAGEVYVAELVHREHRGASRVWFSARTVVSGLSGGFLSEPASADVVVRSRTSSTPVATISVDTEDAAVMLSKVQDDLDRLDVATFHQQWGLR